MNSSRGFSGLSRHIQESGLSPEVFAAQYPRDTALMTRVYLDRQGEVDSAKGPLLFATDLAMADRVKDALLGHYTPSKGNSQS
jgi:hypothetical protein